MTMHCLKAVSLATLGLAMTAGAALSQVDDIAYADDFVFNNSLFVMYHEIGHLLIGELDIPVLGREEDAADSLASILLLVEETDEADQALIDSADGWSLSNAYVTVDNPEYDISEFYGEHSLDLQRSFAAVCMMVGSNAEVFNAVATDFGMDEDRQASCEATYYQALGSWMSLLEPHMTETGPQVEIVVHYDGTDDYADIAAMLQDGELLEYAATQTVMGFDLPRPIALIAAECGYANAYYDPNEGHIVFCYELASYFYELIAWASEEVE